MTEVSRPVQIALLAVVLFAVAWFVALKPGDSNESTTAAAPAPAQTTAASEPTPTKTTAEKAPEPTTQSSAQPAETPAKGSVEEVAAVGADRASAAVVRASGTPSASAQVDDDVVEVSALPADVRRAISKKQVVVLLFWNNKGADDVAVFRSVKHLSRRGGRVYVKTDSAKHVSDYSGITGGAQVLQTPTVIVVDRKKKAITLPGYVDGATINHVVGIAVS
jgi:type IV secretory pathway VirB10-like protein